MIEVAEQVAGSLKSIDLRKLVDELAARAKRLPQRIVNELASLRDYLSRTVLDIDLWGEWAARLFATLILVMTIAIRFRPTRHLQKAAKGLDMPASPVDSAALKKWAPCLTSARQSPVEDLPQPMAATQWISTDITMPHSLYLYDNYGGFGGFTEVVAMVTATGPPTRTSRTSTNRSRTSRSSYSTMTC